MAGSRDQFVQFAETQCGTTGRFSTGSFGLTKNTSWSAAFVSACAKKTGDLNTYIPKAIKAQDIADLGASKGNISNTGIWVEGPAQGNMSNKPERGDIVLLTWDGNGSNRANQVGIVKDYNKDDDTVDVIIGDYGKSGTSRSQVCMTTYGSTYRCIKGYFRPSWDSNRMSDTVDITGGVENDNNR